MIEDGVPEKLKTLIIVLAAGAMRQRQCQKLRPGKADIERLLQPLQLRETRHPIR